MCACMRVCVHACMCACMCACVHMCMYVCMCGNRPTPPNVHESQICASPYLDATIVACPQALLKMTNDDDDNNGGGGSIGIVVTVVIVIIVAAAAAAAAGRRHVCTCLDAEIGFLAAPTSLETNFPEYSRIFPLIFSYCWGGSPSTAATDWLTESTRPWLPTVRPLA